MRPFSSVSDISDKFSAGKWRRHVGLRGCVGCPGRQGEFLFVALLYVDRCRYGNELSDCVCLVLVGVQWCPAGGRGMLVLRVIGGFKGTGFLGMVVLTFAYTRTYLLYPHLCRGTVIVGYRVIFSYISKYPICRYIELRCIGFSYVSNYRNSLRISFRTRYALHPVASPCTFFGWYRTKKFDASNIGIVSINLFVFSASFTEPSSDIDSRH